MVAESRAGENRRNEELRLTVEFTLNIWGLNITPEIITVRAGRHDSSLIQASVFNGLPNTEYNYEITRAGGGEVELTISGGGAIGTANALTLLAPRTRHTITAQVRAAGGGEEILDTVAVIVRPRPLEFLDPDYREVGIALAPNDRPGTPLGRAFPRYGEGDYEYSVNSPLLAIDESGLVFLTGSLAGIDSIGYTVTVRAGSESAEVAEAVISGLVPLVWEVEPSSLLIGTGATGEVADINFTAATPNESGFYRFTVVNSADTAKFINADNFVVDNLGTNLSLQSPFAAAQTGEIELLAVNLDGVRTLTATVTVRVVEAVAVSVSPATVRLTTNAGAAGVFATARAEKGVGGFYSYSLGRGRPPEIIINPSTGELSQIAEFLDEAEPQYRFDVIATDGAGLRGTAVMEINIEYLPRLNLHLSRTNVRLLAGGGRRILSQATATGGRGNYVYSLEDGGVSGLTIDAATGEISYPGAERDLVASARIIVESGGLRREAPFSLVVWDLIFESLSNRMEVRAETPKNSIGHVFVAEPLPGVVYNYEITRENGVPFALGEFSIISGVNSSNIRAGAISLLEPRTRHTITAVLHVEAEGRGGEADSEKIEIVVRPRALEVYSIDEYTFFTVRDREGVRYGQVGARYGEGAGDYEYSIFSRQRMAVDENGVYSLLGNFNEGVIDGCTRNVDCTQGITIQVRIGNETATWTDDREVAGAVLFGLNLMSVSIPTNTKTFVARASLNLFSFNASDFIVVPFDEEGYRYSVRSSINFNNFSAVRVAPGTVHISVVSPFTEAHDTSPAALIAKHPFTGRRFEHGFLVRVVEEVKVSVSPTKITVTTGLGHAESGLLATARAVGGGGEDDHVYSLNDESPSFPRQITINSKTGEIGYNSAFRFLANHVVEVLASVDSGVRGTAQLTVTVEIFTPPFALSLQPSSGAIRVSADSAVLATATASGGRIRTADIHYAYTLTNHPPQVSINVDNGELVVVSLFAETGVWTLTVAALDGNDERLELPFTLSVVSAPEFLFTPLGQPVTAGVFGYSLAEVEILGEGAGGYVLSVSPPEGLENIISISESRMVNITAAFPFSQEEGSYEYIISADSDEANFTVTLTVDVKKPAPLEFSVTPVSLRLPVGTAPRALATVRAAGGFDNQVYSIGGIEEIYHLAEDEAGGNNGDITAPQIIVNSVGVVSLTAAITARIGAEVSMVVESRVREENRTNEIFSKSAQLTLDIWGLHFNPEIVEVRAGTEVSDANPLLLQMTVINPLPETEYNYEITRADGSLFDESELSISGGVVSAGNGLTLLAPHTRHTVTMLVRAAGGGEEVLATVDVIVRPRPLAVAFDQYTPTISPDDKAGLLLGQIIASEGEGEDYEYIFPSTLLTIDANGVVRATVKLDSLRNLLPPNSPGASTILLFPFMVNIGSETVAVNTVQYTLTELRLLVNNRLTLLPVLITANTPAKGVLGRVLVADNNSDDRNNYRILLTNSANFANFGNFSLVTVINSNIRKGADLVQHAPFRGGVLNNAGEFNIVAVHTVAMRRLTARVEVDVVSPYRIYLSETSARVIPGSRRRILSQATALGGFGNHVYSLSLNAGTTAEEIINALEIDSESGEIILNRVDTAAGGRAVADIIAESRNGSETAATTVQLTLNFWGLHITPDIRVTSATVRAETAITAFMQVTVVNPLPEVSYNYEITRANGVPFGENEITINSEGEISAGEGLVLQTPHARHTITALVHAVAEGRGGEADWETVEIIVRPRALVVDSQNYTFFAATDGAGVLYGKVSARFGEGAGDYEYTIDSSEQPLAINENGVYSLTAAFNSQVIRSQMVRITARLDEETEVLEFALIVGEVSFSASPASLLITTNTTGATVRAELSYNSNTLLNADGGNYRYILTSSVNVGNFSLLTLENGGVDLSVHAPFAAAQEAEFNIIAEHTLAVRRLTATVTVRVVNPLAVSVLPQTATITADIETGILATVRAAGGSGSYIYLLEGEPEQIAINFFTGEIRFTAAFLAPENYAFTVIAENAAANTGRVLAAFAVEVEPSSLRLSLQPSSEIVRTGVESGNIAAAAAFGGRLPHRYSLTNNPPQIGIGENNGALTLSSAFNNAGVWTLTVLARDADGMQAESFLTLSVLAAAEFRLSPTAITVTAGVLHYALARAQVIGAGAEYNYALTPPAGLAGKLSIPAAGGAVSLRTSFFPSQTGTHTFTIAANSSEQNLRAVLTVEVVAIPPLVLRQNITLVRVPAGMLNLAAATAEGGFGNYVYSLVGDNLPPELAINSETGEISLTASVNASLSVNFRVAVASRAEENRISEKLRATVQFTLSIWGLNFLPDGRSRVRRAGRQNRLMGITIFNPLPEAEYNYEIRRTNGEFFSATELTVVRFENAAGDTNFTGIASGAPLTLLAPHTRHTITAQVRVFIPDGEEILDTVMIVVRPRALGIGSFTRYSHLAPSDGPGVLVGKFDSVGGEGAGDYEYFFDSPTLPLAADANGVVRLTAALSPELLNTVLDFSIIPATVQFSDQSSSGRAFLYSSAEEISFSVFPTLAVITAGVTGVNAAAVSLRIPEIPVNSRDPAGTSEDRNNYRFTVANSANSANFPGLENFGFTGSLNAAGEGLNLAVVSPFTTPQTGEFEIIAEHTLAMRKLTLTMQVQVINPLAVSVLPQTATITAGIETAGVLAAARAAGGSGNYTYLLKGAPPQITINFATGNIRFTAPFSSPTTYLFTVVADDGAGLGGEAEFAAVIAPLPLNIALQPDSKIVRTETGAGNIATAAAEDGRAPYMYSLENNAPPQVSIGAESGVLEFTAAFNNAGVWTLTVAARDEDSMRADALFTLSVLAAPELHITPQTVTVIAGVDGYAAAAARVFGAGENNYVFSLTPPPGLENKITISGDGAVRITAAFLATQTGQADFGIIAAGAEATLTATLAVSVAPPPQPLVEVRLLNEVPPRVAGGGARAVAVAAASGGFSYYRYSLEGDNLPDELFINPATGEISLTAAVNAGVSVVVDVVAESRAGADRRSEEFRATVQFTLNVWGLNAITDVNITVEAGRIGPFTRVRVFNGLPEAEYNYEIMRAEDGEAKLTISAGRFIIGVNTLTLLAPRTRHTITAQVRAFVANGGEEVVRKFRIIVRPPTLSIDFNQYTPSFSPGDAGGLLLGKLTASGGEGAGDYEFFINVRPYFDREISRFFAIDENGLARTTRNLSFLISPEGFRRIGQQVTIVFGARLANGGPERTEEIVFTDNDSELGSFNRNGVLINTLSVVVTTDAIAVGALGRIFVGTPHTRDRIHYRFLLTNSADFAGFGNFSVATVFNSGIIKAADVVHRLPLIGVQESGGFEIIAEHTLAMRRLTARMSVQVVQVSVPTVFVSPAAATVTANSRGGFLAAVRAEGGDGNYTFSLGRGRPPQIAINSPGGGIREIRYTSPFTALTNYVFNVLVEDGAGVRAVEKAFSLTIAPAPLAISSPLPVFLRTDDSSGEFALAAASGGRTPYIYSLTNSPPPQIGIGENSGALTLSSAFNNTGVWTLTVAVADSDGAKITALLTLSVLEAPELVITPFAAAAGTITATAGVYGYTLAAARVEGGAAAEYSYSLTPPEGLAGKLFFSGGGGAIRLAEAFTAEQTGLAHFGVVATNAETTFTATLALTVAPQPPLELGLDNTSVRVARGSGAQPLATAAATGGFGGYVYLLEKNGAPDALVINPATGEISVNAKVGEIVRATASIIAGSRISGGGRIGPQLWATVRLTLDVWGLGFSPESATLRSQAAAERAPHGSPTTITLVQITVLSSLPDAEYDYEITRTNGESFPALELRISNGMIIAGVSLTLLESQTRHTVTARVRAFTAAGGGEEVLDTVEIVVRPWPLEFGSQQFIDFPALGDPAGLIIGEFSVLHGEGDYEFSAHSSLFSVAIEEISEPITDFDPETRDESIHFAIIRLAGPVSEDVPRGRFLINAITLEVRAGAETIQTGFNTLVLPRPVSLRIVRLPRHPRDRGTGCASGRVAEFCISHPVFIPVGFTGIAALLEAVEDFNQRRYVYELNNSADYPGFGNFSLIDRDAGNSQDHAEWRVNTPFTEAQTGEVEAVTFHDRSGRRITATVQVHVVEPFSVFISPLSVRATTNTTAGILASVRTEGGLGDTTFSLGGNRPSEIAIDIATGEIRYIAPFLNDEDKEYIFDVIATDSIGRRLTITLTMTVAALPPLNLRLTETSARLFRGTGTQVLSQAAASGGRVNFDYVYSLARNGAPESLTIDRASGELILNGAGTRAVQATVNIIAASGELRATARFTLGIWSWEITPDRNEEVFADVETSDANPALMNFNILNPRANTEYSYEITRTNGESFAAAELAIDESGVIRAGDGLSLLAPRARHTITAQVRALANRGGEEVLDTVTVVVRPHPLTGRIEFYTTPVIGDGAGVLLGKFSGQDGEGDDYEYAVDSSALPLAIDQNGVFYLTSTINLRAGVGATATITVRLGSESAGAVARYLLSDVSFSVNPSSVLITAGATAAVARAALRILPANFQGLLDFDSGNYRYTITSSAGVGNFSLNTVRNGVVDLEINPPFTAAQEEAEFNIIAVHTLSMRRLTAALKARVVEPLEVSLPATVTVTVNIESGVLAAARASGGEGGYRYSLAEEPAQITVDSTGEIRFTSPFLSLTTYAFSVVVQDGEGRRQAAAFAVTVAPSLRLLLEPSLAVVRPAQTLAFALATAFGGVAPYSYLLTNAPPNITVSENGGLIITLAFTAEQAGTLTMGVIVRDEGGMQAGASLTLLVAAAPEFVFAPLLAGTEPVTAGVYGYALADTRVIGPLAEYTFSITPPEGLGNILSIPAGGGIISITAAFLPEHANESYEFTIAANSSEENYLATLTLDVVGFEPLEFNLGADSVRVPERSAPPQILATATATHGYGNFVYSFELGETAVNPTFGGGAISAPVDINPATGEIFIANTLNFTGQVVVSVFGASGVGIENRESEELRATARFTLDVWGLDFAPGKSAEVRAGIESSDANASLIQVSIDNPLPEAEYNYEITRTDGSLFGASELTISGGGEIGAGDGLSLLAPRARHTIAVRVRAFVDGGESILDTVNIVVRPRPLAVFFNQYTPSISSADEPGIALGQITAGEGEGAGEYRTFIRTVPFFGIDISRYFSVDENGIVRTARALSFFAEEINGETFEDGQPVTLSIGVRLGGESVRRQALFVGGVDFVSLERSSRELVNTITVAITTDAPAAGNLAKMFIDSVNPRDRIHYRFLLTNFADFAGFDSFSLLTVINSGIIKAADVVHSSPFVNVLEGGKFGVVAEHTLAMRRVTAVVSVQIVRLLSVFVSPPTATVTANTETGVLATVRAERGEGGYTYSLEGAPSQITINTASGEIGFNSAFSSLVSYTFNAVAEDGEGRLGTVAVVVTVAPSPLALSLQPSSAIVRTNNSSGEFALAAASGGRPPHIYSLTNNPPPQIGIGESSGALTLSSAFSGAGVWTLTVAAQDAPGAQTITAFLTLSVLTAPELILTPAATAAVGAFGYALTESRVRGAGAEYTFSITPPEGLENILSLPAGGGAISVTAAFLPSQEGTHEFVIAANSSEENFTATLEVEVVIPEPFELSLTVDAERVLGSGARTLGTATAAGGFGNLGDYVYSLAGGGLPEELVINSAGEILLTAAVNVSVQTVVSVVAASQISEVSEEFRATVQFTLGVWGLNITPDKNITVRAGHDGAALMQVSIFNPLPETEYNYEITRADGAPFGAGGLTINNTGEISAENTLTLLAPQTRHTITARVRAFVDGGEEVLTAVEIVVRPRVLGGEFIKYTNPAPGDKAGLLLGRIRGSGGEADYEYTINSPVLPLAVDENGVVRLTGTVGVLENIPDIAAVVRAGSESAEVIAAFEVEEFSVRTNPAPVLITINATGHMGGIFVDGALSGVREGYRFAINDFADFPNFGNLSLITVITDSGNVLTSLNINLPFTAAQAAGEFEIVALHTLATRKLTATAAVRLVQSLALFVPAVTATTNIRAGILATVQAAGGEGEYSYGLGGGQPLQIIINPATGEISYISAFLSAADYTFDVIATDGEGRRATATMAVQVELPAPLTISLSEDSFRLFNVNEARALATATAADGFGGYVYSLAEAESGDGVVPYNLAINSTTGEISITAAVNPATAGSETEVVNVIAASGDLRATVKFTVVVWGLDITPDKNITVRVDGADSARMQVDIVNPLPEAEYNYEITQINGADGLTISNTGEIGVENTLTLLAPHARHTITAQVRVFAADGGEEITETVKIIVRPLALRLGEYNPYVRVFAASDGAGVLLGEISASEGEGTGEYRYSLIDVNNASQPPLPPLQPLAIDENGIVRVTGALAPFAEDIVTVGIRVRLGNEFNTITLTLFSLPLDLVSPDSLLITVNTTLNVGRIFASHGDVAEEGYRFRLTNFANFANFNNFALVTTGAGVNLEIVSFFPAVQSGQIGIVAEHTVALRQLTAAISVRVVESLVAFISPEKATVTTRVQSGILATARAARGAGDYSFSLGSGRPPQVVINPDSGEISYISEFLSTVETDYVFDVIATDGEGRRATVTMAVQVKPLQPLNIRLNETSARLFLGSGARVLATATAADGFGDHVYSLEGENVPEELAIDRETGVFSLTAPINTGVQEVINVIVRSRGQGAKRGKGGFAGDGAIYFGRLGVGDYTGEKYNRARRAGRRRAHAG